MESKAMVVKVSYVQIVIQVVVSNDKFSAIGLFIVTFYLSS